MGAKATVTLPQAARVVSLTSGAQLRVTDVDGKTLVSRLAPA
jgi:hypothetical protein